MFAEWRSQPGSIVELKTRFVGPDFHANAGVRRKDFCRFPDFLAIVSDTEIVIIIRI